MNDAADLDVNPLAKRIQNPTDGWETEEGGGGGDYSLMQRLRAQIRGSEWTNSASLIRRRPLGRGRTRA